MKSLTLLGYHEFFTSEEPTDRLVLAKRIGADDLLNTIGLVMGAIYKKGIPETDQLLREWFTYFGHDYTRSPSYTILAERLSVLRRKNHNTTYTLISVEPLLRMFLWIRENQGNIPSIGSNRDASVTLDLFEIVMQFNQDVLANFKKGRVSAQSENDRLVPYRQVLTQAFSSNDFVNVDLAQLFYCQIFKAARLMDYLENNPKYQLLHKKVLSDFRCTSNKEYVQAIGSLIASSLSSMAGKTTIGIPDGPDQQKNIALFEKIAIQPSSAPSDYDRDFLDLRAAPLYKIAEGQYRVINDPFLINTIYDGLIFYCSRLCMADSSLLNNLDFLGEIRLDFSEGVLLYEIADNIFSQPSDIKLTGEQAKILVGSEGRESDFFVCRHQKAATLESKDFFMAGAEKLSYNFATIEAGLKKNGRLAKAVLQSTKNVARTLVGVYPIGKVAAADLDVYPIIVVHSALYSCPGLNFWANRWFDQELTNLKSDPRYAGLDYSSVRPITIVEMDTLILYEEQFKSGLFDLFVLVDGYHKETSMRATFNSGTETKRHALSQIPFAEYIRNLAHENGVEIQFTRIDSILNQIGIK